MQKIALSLLLLSLPFLSGCVNLFQKYYNATLDKNIPDGMLSYCDKEDPVLFKQDVPAAEVNYLMFSKSLVEIGQSNFTYTGNDPGNLKKFAKELKVCAVVVDSAYLGKEQGVVPIFNYTPPPSYSANTYGNVGGTNYNSTTYLQSNNPGTITTSYVPYSIDKHEVHVKYFIKLRNNPVLGIWPQEMSIEQKKTLGRNTGIVIKAIREGSPAYFADLLPGDIIIGADGKDIAEYQRDKIDFIGINKGKNVKFLLMRNGKEIEKEVHLGTGE